MPSALRDALVRLGIDPDQEHELTDAGGDPGVSRSYLAEFIAVGDVISEPPESAQNIPWSDDEVFRWHFAHRGGPNPRPCDALPNARYCVVIVVIELPWLLDWSR